ncbi:hypothetical protein ACWEN6_17770 [Sphaerisporangium sp. NPDC004334]
MSLPGEPDSAGPGRGGERLRRHPAARAAHRLCRTLERHGITAEVHEGRGLALVSVCVDLVAWTDRGPAGDPVTAARRVADRYTTLRHGRPAPSSPEPAPAPSRPEPAPATAPAFR